MGVIVTGRDYTNRYRPEIVDWLLGNVGDWQKITLACEFSVEKQFSQSKPLLLENSGFDLVLGDGTEWSEFGFDTGDVITWSLRFASLDGNGNPIPPFPITISQTRQIVLLQGDRITLDNAWLNDINMLPFNNAQLRLDQVVIYVDKKPQGAEILYSHLPNSEADNANLISFIDGTKTRMIAEYMHTLTGWQNMDFIGLQSGMSLRSGRWIFDGKEGTHTYKYRFEIEFMLSSFFEDLSNFETMTAPSQVFDAESLTDNFEIIGFPEWNNPNTQIKSDKKATKRLGNTGWFNENFNGLDNDFTVLSVEYTDVVSGSIIQRLSYGAETKVKAVISGIPNLANGLTKLGVGFIFLPEDEELFKELETPFHQNLFVNTAGGLGTGVFTPTATPSTTVYTGYTNVSGVSMDVKDVHFYIQGSNLVYEATFRPSAGFANYIGGLDEIERNYALWVSVGDRNEITNFADRVSLLLDYNTMDLFIPPVGEYAPMSIKFGEHPYTETEVRGAGCGDFRVEDDILTAIPFKVDITGDIPTKLEFLLEVERIADGVKYELQRYSIDLTGFPNDGAGVPQWNYDQIRGFKLESGNNKNWVKVKRDPTEDSGNEKAYIAYYAFKIRWEDWILRTGVPFDFYNSNELNNGFNNDWVQYLSNSGWRFQFTVHTFASLNGSLVRYVNIEELEFKDYDTNGDIQTTWSILRESDGTNLPVSVEPSTGKPLGVLLKGEQVRLQVLYKKLSGNFASLGAYYGTICIEVDKGAGQFEFRQLSTVWGSESDNPLIPLQGESKTKKTLVSPSEILLECLVEPSLLTEAQRYKLSSRLGCISDCVDLEFNQDTKLMFFFDSSGSMDGSLAPISTMRDSLLRDRLLPFYNNDLSLYNSNVTLTNVPSERTLQKMNFLNQIPPSGNVVVFVFQDEAGGVYYPDNGDLSVRNASFDNDISLLRSRLNNFDSNYYKGAVFQVENTKYPPLGRFYSFKEMLERIRDGIVPYDGVNGLSDYDNIKYYFDVTEGGTPQYYLDLIITALNELGFNV